MIIIELRGPLARYGCEHGEKGRIEAKADNGVTVRQILNQVPIPLQHVGLIVVNGKKGSLQTMLSEGDSVVIFPVVAGG